MNQLAFGLVFEIEDIFYDFFNVSELYVIILILVTE